MNRSTAKVYVGIHSDNDTSVPKVFGIEKIILHPQYTHFNEGILNDIALLQVSDYYQEFASPKLTHIT